MYDDISPKLERKIVGGFLLVALLFGALAFSRGQSVHVGSVVREAVKDGSVDYLVEVVKPTDKYITATVSFATGTEANDGGVPWGAARQKQKFSINSASTRVIKFSFKNGIILGPKYSASISSIE